MEQGVIDNNGSMSKRNKIIISSIAVVFVVLLIVIITLGIVFNKTGIEIVDNEDVQLSIISYDGETLEVSVKKLTDKNISSLRFILENANGEVYEYTQNANFLNSDTLDFSIPTKDNIENVIKISVVPIFSDIQDVTTNITQGNTTQTGIVTSSGGGGGGGSGGGGSGGGDDTPPVNNNPISIFNASTGNGNIPLTVLFNASASSDSDGSIVNYSWDFGDNTKGDGINVSHIFTLQGNYQVNLTVRDDDGATDRSNVTITATIPPPPTITITSPLENTMVALTNVDVDFSLISFSIGSNIEDHAHFYLDVDPIPYMFYNGVTNDVQYNGVSATDVTRVDSNTIRFLNLADSNHTITAKLADLSHIELTNPEATFQVTFLVDTVLNICPNGILEPGEFCDGDIQICTTFDNYVGTETCNNQCTGYDLCGSEDYCGDSAINGPEICDDGGTTSGDGCSSTCNIEAGWVCNGQPSVCSPVASCDLTSASWNPISATENDVVSLNVVGDNCAGDVNYEILKKPLDEVVDSFTSTLLNPSWTVVYLGDGSNSDYYFTATLVSDITKNTQSGIPDLNVSQAVATVCGNNVTEVGEACDGNSLSCNVGGYNGIQDCLLDCSAYESCNPTESCGDTFINGNENCDDGNTDPGDGCSSICLIEANQTGLSITGVTSSVLNLAWETALSTNNYNIYLAPEPGLLGDVNKRRLIGSTPLTTFQITGLAANVDNFIRVESVETGATMDAHGKTVGGQLAQIEFKYGNRDKLDTPLKEVHLIAPNILHLVLFNPEVHSYTPYNNWVDDGVDEILNYSGWDWHAGIWSVERNNGSFINVNEVYRHSIPSGQFDPIYRSYLEFDHHIYLVLDENIGSNEILNIVHTGDAGRVDNIEVPHYCRPEEQTTVWGKTDIDVELDFTLAFSDKYLTSTAIQVNQLGYVPDATKRYAYVSGWMGADVNGNTKGVSLDGFPATASVLKQGLPLDSKEVTLSNIPLNKRFTFDTTNASGIWNGTCFIGTYTGPVWDGSVFVDNNTERTFPLGGGPCIIIENWQPYLRPVVDFDVDAGSQVREIDLSALSESDIDVYQVHIPGVGVSYPIMVSYLGLEKAWYVFERGLYQNRWGRDLQPQWTDWATRPPDHTIVFTAENKNSGYGGLSDFSINTPTVGERPLAGGYHDAADYDMQWAHYANGVRLLTTYEINPDAYRDGQLTIPESGNGIPDLLDEALYAIKVWEQLQEENDNVGNACDLCLDDPENDVDGDNICKKGAFTNPMTGTDDNCPWHYNPLQEDIDNDGIGNACDKDYVDDGDGDGVVPTSGGGWTFFDNCIEINNPLQEDFDGDEIGDACDVCLGDSSNDVDNDGVCVGEGFAGIKTGQFDNCPLEYNPGQEDCDGDGVGDACDLDSYCAQRNDLDGDTIMDLYDNCVDVPNLLQEDNSPFEVGGVRQGVQTIGHVVSPGARYSDEDEIPYWTYSRGSIHSARVAGMFAKASYLLQDIDQTALCGSPTCKSDELEIRAKKAFNYSYNNGAPKVAELGENDPKGRILSFFAAGELYRLTGDSFYNEVFEANWDTSESWSQGPNFDPLFVLAYVNVSDNQTVLNQIFNRLDLAGGVFGTSGKQFTDAELPKVEYTHGHRNPRRIAQRNAWGEESIVGSSFDKIFLRLYLDSVRPLDPNDKQDMIDAISMTADYVLGGNPASYIYTTGLGQNYPQEGLWHDSTAFYEDGFGNIPGYAVFGPAGTHCWGSGYDIVNIITVPPQGEMPNQRRYLDAGSIITTAEGGPGLNSAFLYHVGQLLPSQFHIPTSWLPGQSDHKKSLVTLTTTDTILPDIPTNVNTVAVSDTKISLSWGVSNDNTEVLWYQIYRDGILIGNTKAYSGEVNYIDSGLTSSTSYDYEVVATDIGFLLSSPALVQGTTSSDNSAPIVIDLISKKDPNKIKLIFNEELDKTTSENIASYSIDTGLMITDAFLLDDKITVILLTDEQLPKIDYTLDYSGVTDLAGNGIGNVREINYEFVWEPNFARSMLLWNGEVLDEQTAKINRGQMVQDSAEAFKGEWYFRGLANPWSPPAFNPGIRAWRVSLSNYDTFMFWVKADEVGKTLNLSVTRWNAFTVPVNIDPYIEGGSLDTTYRLVAIPFADMPTSNNSLAGNNLSLDFVFDQGFDRLFFRGYGTTPGFNIDEIWAVDTTGPLLSPLAFNQGIDFEEEKDERNIFQKFFDWLKNLFSK